MFCFSDPVGSIAGFGRIWQIFCFGLFPGLGRLLVGLSIMNRLAFDCVTVLSIAAVSRMSSRGRASLLITEGLFFLESVNSQAGFRIGWLSG